MDTVQIIGIILLILGGIMVVYPGFIWWGILVALIGVVLAASDWIKAQAKKK